MTLGFLPTSVTRIRGVNDYSTTVTLVTRRTSKMQPRGVNLRSTSLSSFLGEASFLSCNAVPSLKAKITTNISVPSDGSTEKANDVDPIVPRIPFQEVTTMTYCVGIQAQWN